MKMEERISFKRKMKTVKIAHLLILSTVLFQSQAAAYITDCNVSPFSNNGIGYITTHRNRSRLKLEHCLSTEQTENEIDQSILKVKMETFRKEYLQGSSLSTMTLNQKHPKASRMMIVQPHNPSTINKNTHDTRRYVYPNMRRDQGTRWNFEQGFGKSSNQRTDKKFNWWRYSENKDNLERLATNNQDSKHVADSRKRSNRRHVKPGLNRVGITLQRILSESRISGRSIDIWNSVVREINDRRIMNEKEIVKTAIRYNGKPSSVIRNQDSFGRNSLTRLLRATQSHQERSNKLPRRSIGRDNREERLRRYIDMPDQNTIVSIKPINRHYFPVIKSLLERNKQNAKHSHAFLNRHHRARLSLKSSIKPANVQRRSMERVQESTSEQPFAQNFQNNIVTNQYTRRSLATLRVILKESNLHLDNTQFFRQSVGFKKRIGNIMHSRTPSTRNINERQAERIARSQGKIFTKERMQYKIRFERFVENIQNRITLERAHQTRIRVAKQLNMIQLAIPVESFQDSNQLIPSSKTFQENTCSDRIIQQEEKKGDSKLEKSYQSRLYQKQRRLERQQTRSTQRRQEINNNFENNLSRSVSTRSSERIRYITSSERFISRQRRDIDERLLDELSHRRTLHRQFPRQLSKKSQQTRSISSEEIFHHFRHTERFLDSRFGSRKNLEGITGEVTNTARILIRTIREHSIIRKQASLTNSFLQDQTSIRVYRKISIDGGRNSRISQLLYDNRRHHTFHFNAANSERLYRSLDNRYLINFAELFVEQPIKNSVTEDEKPATMRRTFQQIKRSGAELITMPSIKQERFTPYSSKSLSYNIAATRNINDGVISRLSLKSNLSPSGYQKPLTEDNGNAVSTLRNAVANIMGMLFEVLNTLRQKSTYIASSLKRNVGKMLQELSLSGNSVVKSSQNDWKRDYGMQDVFIAGIGIFAATRLHSVKSMA